MQLKKLIFRVQISSAVAERSLVNNLGVLPCVQNRPLSLQCRAAVFPVDG